MPQVTATQATPAPAPPAAIPGQLLTPPPPQTSPATAAEMYEALRAQGRVLDNQMNELENVREDIADQLRNPAVTGADRAGLETRLGQIDGRIRRSRPSA